MNDEERKQNIAKRAQRILDIAVNMAATIGGKVASRIEEINIHYDGYAEPGYESESNLIATGNWNSVRTYDNNTNQSVEISDLPNRICDLFERMGIECEFNDEWFECSCGKLVRSSADSYSWTPSFQYYDGEISCIKCLLEDPEGYLLSLEGNTEAANTMHEIDPNEHGYIRVNDISYQTGYYPGQNDSPEEIATELSKKGVNRFLFNIESTGQFDTKWSVYIHKDEEYLLDNEDEECEDEECEDEECEDEECEDCSHCTKIECNHPPDLIGLGVQKVEVSVNMNDHPCKCCGTGLNAGETPCWRCGMNNPTEE